MAKQKKKKRKQQRRSRQSFLVSLLIVVVAAFAGFLYDFYQSGQEWNVANVEATFKGYLGIDTDKKEVGQRTENPDIHADGTATYHFLDVGQGDATFIEGSDGTRILIDTGRSDDSDKRIISYLNQLVGTGGRIDVLIFTHGDSDHIGNGDLVLTYFDVGEVWMNGFDGTTKVYEKLLDAIGESDADYLEPKRGETLTKGMFTFHMLNPATENTRNNTNDASLAFRLEQGAFSVMFTGDASSSVEKELLQLNTIFQSTVMHAGHHGSKDSNSQEWITAVAPQVFVYSASQNNSYGHPSAATLDRVQSAGITQIYGTSVNGMIEITANSDGAYEMKLEKE